MSRSGMVGMMTDPSPQEELRAEIAAILRLRSTDGVVEEHLKLLLPLFAARVAAIEADWKAWETQRNATMDQIIYQRDTERAAGDYWEERALKAEADLTAAQERIAAAIKERDVALDLVEDWSTDCREVEKQRDAALSRLAAERKQAAAQALRRAADELPGADLSEFRIEQWTTDTEKVQGWLRYRASRMETP